MVDMKQLSGRHCPSTQATCETPDHYAQLSFYSAHSAHMLMCTHAHVKQTVPDSELR